MEIRALRPSDDRSAFESGDEALDRFFHRYAGQNQFRHYIGVTYVAVEDDHILGFATVAPRHIDMEDLPERVRKKLPRYPLPVLGLVRLAVDRSAQSLGLGGQLLRFVLKLATTMADEVGCAGVVVDAKHGAVDFYAKYGFVHSSRSRATRRRVRDRSRCGCPSRRSGRRASRRTDHRQARLRLGVSVTGPAQPTTLQDHVPLISSHRRPWRTSSQQKRTPWSSFGFSERMRSNTRSASATLPSRQTHSP